MITHRLNKSPKRLYLSFGDIADSRVWISFELTRFRNWEIVSLKFKKTYVGTVFGISFISPHLTILGHVRGTK